MTSRENTLLLLCGLQETFHTVLSKLWNKFINIGMSLEYSAVVAQLYEQVRCQLEMEVLLEKHGGQVRVSTFTHTLWSMQQVRCQLEMEVLLEKYGDQVRMSTFTHSLVYALMKLKKS